MPSCQSIDSLVTPYVDNELAGSDRLIVEAHLHVCASCHSRVAAARAVRTLIESRKAALQQECAPAALREWCTKTAGLARRVVPEDAAPVRAWQMRLAPLALAASLVLIVAGAFLYQLTQRSATVMAAELAADHVKCFALNKVLGTRQARSAVEQSMAAGFGWQARLPDRPEDAGLELLGARPCLYGEGRVAHIMYRYRGRPLSLFMLPDTARTESLIEVLGHHCAIWSSGDRTFVLVARESRSDLERVASFVHASLR